MEQLQQAWENPEPKDEVVKGWTPGDLVQYSITLWYRTLERQRAKRWYLCFCCRSRPPSATSSPAERRSNGCYAQLKDNLRRWKKRLKRIFVAKRSRGALYPLHSLLKPIAPGVGATYSSCQRARLCGLLHHTRDSAESRKIEALLHLSGRESEQFHSQLVAEATDLWSGVAVQYEESAIAIIRFLWAILAGRYQVARVLWQKSEVCACAPVKKSSIQQLLNLLYLYLYLTSSLPSSWCAVATLESGIGGSVLPAAHERLSQVHSL